MTDTRLLNRLAETDAYPADSPLPDEAWTSAVALQEIERRAEPSAGSGTFRVTRPRRQPRRLALAAAAFALIVVIVTAVVVLASDQNTLPDVTNDAPLTPLEVGQALNAAIVAGDWEAVRVLYADDATYTLVDDGFGIHSSVRHRLATLDSFRPDRAVDRLLVTPKFNRSSSVGVPFNVYEWIEDESFDGFDDLAADAMALYTQGVTTALSCTQPGPGAVVCDNVLEGHAFLSGAPLTVDTLTVVDGLITHQEYDTLGARDEDSFTLQVEYQTYVGANHAELEEDLFYQLGRLTITPDTVETHRQLIAEWSAQR